MDMKSKLQKKFAAVIRAELDLMTKRHELAIMLCELSSPEDVAEQIAAQRAGGSRVIKLERLQDDYLGGRWCNEDA